MEQNREPDTSDKERFIDRIWESARHQDDLFNERLSAFIVLESILLGLVALLVSRSSVSDIVLRAVTVMGLLISLILWYVQARQKYLVDTGLRLLSEVSSEYREIVARRKTRRWPVSSTFLLAHAIPLIVVGVWVALLLVL
jgi:hypothetical protein